MLNKRGNKHFSIRTDVWAHICAQKKWHFGKVGPVFVLQLMQFAVSESFKHWSSLCVTLHQFSTKHEMHKIVALFDFCQPYCWPATWRLEGMTATYFNKPAYHVKVKNRQLFNRSPFPSGVIAGATVAKTTRQLSVFLRTWQLVMVISF